MNSRKGKKYRLEFNGHVVQVFDKKFKAYHYGVGKWGSGLENTIGGWLIKEVDA
jgi:hypothetical protein